MNLSKLVLRQRVSSKYNHHIDRWSAVSKQDTSEQATVNSIIKRKRIQQSMRLLNTINIIILHRPTTSTIDSSVGLEARLNSITSVIDFLTIRSRQDLLTTSSRSSHSYIMQHFCKEWGHSLEMSRLQTQLSIHILAIMVSLPMRMESTSIRVLKPAGHYLGDTPTSWWQVYGDATCSCQTAQ